MRCACLLLLLWGSLFCGAEEQPAEKWKPAAVILRNGRVLKGYVLEGSGEQVTIKIHGMLTRIERQKVRAINELGEKEVEEHADNPFSDLAATEPEWGREKELLDLAKEYLEKYEISREGAWKIALADFLNRKKLTELQATLDLFRGKLIEAEKQLADQREVETRLKSDLERIQAEAQKTKAELTAALAQAQNEILERTREYESRIKVLEEGFAKERAKTQNLDEKKKR